MFSAVHSTAEYTSSIDKPYPNAEPDSKADVRSPVVYSNYACNTQYEH